MDYNYLLFVLGVLVLVVSLGVILSLKTKESFENDQEIISFNKCGRKMVFPNFSSVNLAAQRAALDMTITKNLTKGTCNTPMNNEGSENATDTYSVVRDNFMFYSLKRACLGMKYQNISYRDKNRVSITFSTDTAEDAKNVMYFIMLNPMFVEFNVDSVRTTVAYYPIFHNTAESLRGDPLRAEKVFRYSNYDKTLVSRYTTLPVMIKNPTITFDVVLPIENRGRDSLFNYFSDANPYVTLQNLNLDVTNKNKIINIQMYYLDDNIPTSYQNIGKQLAHPQGGDLFTVPHLVANNKKDLLVFRVDYSDRYGQNSSYKEAFEFNNNINVFFKNYLQPVFTISMDLQVTDLNVYGQIDNQNIVIARMFMNNGYGQYNGCTSISRELDGVQNNNIFMVVLEVGKNDNNAYNIAIVTGKDNSCNYPSNDQSNISLTLPFLSGYQRVRLIFTITPNEKIATAFWKDSNTGLTNVMLARSTHCGDDLNMGRLFKQNPRIAPINNIIMNVDKSVVSQVNSIALGYKNLITEIENFSA